MFDFVGQLLHGRSDPKQQAVHAFQRASITHRKRSQGNSGIAYDRSLINSLKKEHEALIESFGRTYSDAFEPNDFTQLSKQLSEFKVFFQNHLLTENVKLFCYLEKKSASDSQLRKSMRDTRKEINYWSNAVISFCKKYEEPVDVYLHQESFKNEYQAVGQALIHRVQLAENEMYSKYK